MLLGHPLLQAPRSGWVDDQTVGEHYWRIGAYLGEHVEIGEVSPECTSSSCTARSVATCTRWARRACSSTTWKSRRPRPCLLEGVWDFPEAATIPRIVLVRARRR